MIDRLIAEKNNADSLLNYFEFHILPLLNADGYEYSWTTVSQIENKTPNAWSQKYL